MLRALARLVAEGAPPPTRLHRWCLPVGSYAQTCNQELKADMANRDNSLGVPAPRRARDAGACADYAACPVARVVANSFGV